eukprot:1587551-Prymnesium_polylepis.1
MQVYVNAWSGKLSGTAVTHAIFRGIPPGRWVGHKQGARRANRQGQGRVGEMEALRLPGFERFGNIRNF